MMMMMMMTLVRIKASGADVIQTLGQMNRISWNQLLRRQVGWHQWWWSKSKQWLRMTIAVYLMTMTLSTKKVIKLRKFKIIKIKITAIKCDIDDDECWQSECFYQVGFHDSDIGHFRTLDFSEWSRSPLRVTEKQQSAKKQSSIASLIAF